jgi:hypothetical protein
MIFVKEGEVLCCIIWIEHRRSSTNPFGSQSLHRLILSSLYRFIGLHAILVPSIYQSIGARSPLRRLIFVFVDGLHSLHWISIATETGDICLRPCHGVFHWLAWNSSIIRQSIWLSIAFIDLHSKNERHASLRSSSLASSIKSSSVALHWIRALSNQSTYVTIECLVDWVCHSIDITLRSNQAPSISSIAYASIAQFDRFCLHQWQALAFWALLFKHHQLDTIWLYIPFWTRSICRFARHQHHQQQRESSHYLFFCCWVVMIISATNLSIDPFVDWFCLRDCNLLSPTCNSSLLLRTSDALAPFILCSLGMVQASSLTSTEGVNRYHHLYRPAALQIISIKMGRSSCSLHFDPSAIHLSILLLIASFDWCCLRRVFLIP